MRSLVKKYPGYTGKRPSGTAVLYARYSSHAQREVSIEDQLKTNNEFCKREKLKVVAVYYDKHISGRTDKRPDFQKMIANAPESDYVVVYMMERFSRGEYDAPLYKFALAKKGVKVISALENIPDTPEGVMLEKVLEGQAAYFSLDLSRKVKRGLNSNAEKCMYNGSPLFGYDVDENQRYIINEEEAEVVREVFKRYSAGEPSHSIARSLAARGYKTNYGNPVSHTFIHNMIHNERYMGIYIWGDVRKVGGMPQIVTKKEFDTAKKAPRRKIRSMENWHDYPLVGKLFCGLCGEQMHGESATNRHGKRFNYYACRRSGDCNRSRVRCEAVEDVLAESLSELASSPETIHDIAHQVYCHFQQTDDAKVYREMEEEASTISRKQDKLLDLLLNGKITDKVFARKNAELTAQAEEIMLKMSDFHHDEMDVTEEGLVEFLTESFDVKDKDFIFEGLLGKVVLFEDKIVAVLGLIEGATNEPQEVEIALRASEKNPAQRAENGGSPYSTWRRK